MNISRTHVSALLQELDMAYYDSKAELDYVSNGQTNGLCCFGFNQWGLLEKIIHCVLDECFLTFP